MQDDFRFDAADVLDSAPEVLLYGAGSAGRKAHKAIRDCGGRVRAFLDAGASLPAMIDGIPVLAPFIEFSRVGFGSGGTNDPIDPAIANLPVVITVFNRDADPVAIARSLRRHGFGPIVSFPALHALFHDRIGDHFWLGHPRLIERSSDRIAAALSLFADDRSRSVFCSLVEFYRSRDPGNVIAPDDRSLEYLPTDVPGWPPLKPFRVVDCGAYDGDTLERFRDAFGPLDAAACFEPDMANYNMLCRRVAGWGADQRNGISLWPCGVADRTGPVHFDDGLGESSHLSATASGRQITCVALDDALAGFAPSLIKMDIEGAEELALEGMAGLVAAHRPALAICVYHRPTDLWELVAKVAGWGLGYRFYLRHYGYNGFDTVCYAVPRD